MRILVVYIFIVLGILHSNSQSNSPLHISGEVAEEIHEDINSDSVAMVTDMPSDTIRPTNANKELSNRVEDNKNNKKNRQATAWTLISPLGLHREAVVDTLLYNYQRQAVPQLESSAYSTTGNLGAEGETALFFERRARSDFFFRDALNAWLPLPENEKFYNVYVPMTLMSYNTGGGKRSTQDRLRVNFAGNVNRRIGIGGKLDYLYSKGAYESQAVKDFTFGFTAYYKGDRYEVQAYYNNYNMLNKENGGISDDLYITDPAEIQGGVTKVDPKNIPTRLSAAHSRLKGQEFYMNHAYNVGYWKDEQVNDTLTREVYIPVMKFLWTFDYKKDRHMFLNENASEARDFWENTYMNLSETNDHTRYWTIENTFGVQMIEGFQKWAKFGLSAYATYAINKFTMPIDTITGATSLPPGLTPLPSGIEIPNKATQNHMWVGGQIVKQKGSLLTYSADARFGLIGDVSGDVEISGNIQTNFQLFGDTVSVSADGHFKNQAVPYLMQSYRSNHFVWNNDFGKMRNYGIGGELTIPWTQTKLHVGFANMQNYVYFDKNSMPSQERGNIQVFAATLKQKLRFGIWNWDNSLTYQVSSNQAVLPLPTLSVYSNMYLYFVAFKVLNIQLGVDCNYFTSYYGVDYQPATMSFHVQDEIKIGNYPFMNAYVTCKLKKVRFYLMMSHVNQGWFSRDYFSMPHYPMNPRRFQIGLSVDFAN